MKVLVTGSRNWTNVCIIETCLINVNPTILIHGAQRGADTIAGRWALVTRNVEERSYPAKWDLYGRAAGTNRNIEMLLRENTLDEPIDLVIGFPLPQSKGTYHMLRIAAKAGIPCIIIGDPAFLKETDAQA